MKKILALALMLVFLFSAVPAYADGIGDDEIDNYPDVVDYRTARISVGPIQHPKVGFSLQIKSKDTLLPTILESAAIDNPNSFIVPEQDSPVINASIGDKILISNLSRPGNGSKLTYYDIQYRFVPKGEDRHKHEIKSAIVRDFGKVKGIIENLNLEKEGTYEIFLCVADNAPCIGDAINWSTNGNVRSISYNNKNFPKGVFWYFTEALVKVEDAPTEIITTEPHETKEAWTNETHFNPGKTLSQRYNNGDTADLKFIFHNEAQDIAYGDTNYIITHWGAGTQGAFENQIMPAVKKGEATSELSYSYKIDLDKVPESARVNGGIKLAIIADPDNKVANSGTKKNYMTVNIPINGVDIAVSCDRDYTIRIKQGETANIKFNASVDTKQFVGMPIDPVDVDVNINSPSGTVSERIVLAPCHNKWYKSYEIPFATGKPGIYTMEISAYPVGVMDIDLNNNQDKCSITVIVGPAEEPYKGNTDRETRVNLVG